MRLRWPALTRRGGLRSESDPPAAPEHTPDLAQDEGIAQELEHAASEFRSLDSIRTECRSGQPQRRGAGLVPAARSLVEEFVASAD